MTTFCLSDEQAARADALVEPALAFVRARSAALPEAIIAALWRDGDPAAVGAALAAYQNPDGGFGNRLEPDITAPASNPFAARIAMQVLLAVPGVATPTLRDGLATWLRDAQHADGDWHFAPEVLAHPVAPWFAGWTFPSLNPACCLAGYANRLGLATPEMLERVARLFAAKASLDEARTGEFYNLLPYVEYAAGVEFPERDAYVNVLAVNIVATAQRDGGYVDPMHFFAHAIGGLPSLTARIGPDLLASWTDRLLAEPSPDGGWPTPYDDAWRVWETSSALTVLARLRHGV
jgi:hypothetical protein